MLNVLPQFRVTTLLLPAMCCLCFAGFIHILVMPRLSGFVELGAVIFAVVFLVDYMFYLPQQRIGRSLGLILFALLASITNEQTYSFLKAANIAMVFPLFIGLLALTSHFPISFRPEYRFMRMIARYFRGCEFLMSSLKRDPDRKSSRLFL